MREFGSRPFWMLLYLRYLIYLTDANAEWMRLIGGGGMISLWLHDAVMPLVFGSKINFYHVLH